MIESKTKEYLALLLKAQSLVRALDFSELTADELESVRRILKLKPPKIEEPLANPIDKPTGAATRLRM